MSSGFANRRKPRKIGGAEEDNDEGEQGKSPPQYNVSKLYLVAHGLIAIL